MGKFSLVSYGNKPLRSLVATQVSIGFASSAPVDPPYAIGLTGAPAEIRSDRQAQIGDRLFVNTSGGPVKVTLPAAVPPLIMPNEGTTLYISGTGWEVHPLVIDRNGQTILGLAEDLLCDDSRELTFIFAEGTWGY